MPGKRLKPVDFTKDSVERGVRGESLRKEVSRGRRVELGR
jgi:hypothetical protein